MSISDGAYGLLYAWALTAWAAGHGNAALPCDDQEAYMKHCGLDIGLDIGLIKGSWNSAGLQEGEG